MPVRQNFATRAESDTEWREMLNDAISGEIQLCQKPKTSEHSGVAFSDYAALTSLDTSCTVPNFVPTGNIPWPPALQKLRETFCISSMVGVFPAINRIWVTVDSKIVLWDYRGAREFVVFDDIPEVIECVGTPVYPARGVFQDHVRFLLPVATRTMLILLGISIMDDRGLSGVKLINLGYSVKVGFEVLKLDGFPKLGRIFAGAVDGDVYEVQYRRESSPMYPRMYTLRCGEWYKVIGAVGDPLGWLARKIKDPQCPARLPPLRDLVVDPRRGKLLTLDGDSAITVWNPTVSGIEKCFTLSFGYGGSMAHSSSPLARLFIMDPDSTGCSICAISEDGTQYRYRYSDGDVVQLSSELMLKRQVPSLLPSTSGHVISACFAAASVVLFAHHGASDRPPLPKDELTVMTSPSVVLPPSEGCSEVVASIDLASAGISRIDAFALSHSEDSGSPFDQCAQVLHPAQRIIVIHRNGVAMYMQMRPIDTLHAIMACAAPHCYSSLLQRFAKAYDASDYGAMLLQLACGVTSASDAKTAQLESREHSGGLSAGALMGLGVTLISGVSNEVRRKAKEAVSGELKVTIGSVGQERNGQYEIVFRTSPKVNALWLLIARTVFDFWGTSVGSLQHESLAGAFELLRSLSRFILSTYENEVRSPTELCSYEYMWKGREFMVWLPANRKPTVVEVNNVQREIIYRCYQLVNKVTQAIDFLRRCRHIPLPRSDETLQFSDLVLSAEVPLRLGRYCADAFMAADQGVSNAERLRMLQGLERECPSFFDSRYTREYESRAEFDVLTSGNSLSSFSEAQLSRWFQATAPQALVYWRNGSLNFVCTKLNSLKREDVSVKLLLHAAAQATPPPGGAGGARGGVGGASGGPTHALQAQQSQTEPARSQKAEILNALTSTLEQCWVSNRVMADRILGGPRGPGMLWSVEPSDRDTHMFLFAWFFAPRDDAMLQTTLRETVLNCGSPFVASFLERHREAYTEEYIKYLSTVRGDLRRATAESAALSQSALDNVPPEERLAYRIRCAQEALRCAAASRSADCTQLQASLESLEQQRKLLNCVMSFLHNAPESQQQELVASALDTAGGGFGASTRRDAARGHLRALSAQIMSSSELFELGRTYRAYGGAEVQLAVSYAVGRRTRHTSCVLIRQAFATAVDTPEAVAWRLISGFYQRFPEFPLGAVILALERHYVRTAGDGNPRTVQLLAQLGVSAVQLFSEYQDLLSGAADGYGAASDVPLAQLHYSLSVVLMRMAEEVKLGRLQEHVYHSAYQYAAADLQAQRDDGADDANDTLQQAESLLNESTSVFRGGRWNF